MKDKLVRARLPPRPGRPGTRLTRGPKPGFTCCKAGRRGCALCPFTGPAADRRTVVTQVQINHSGQILPILQPITCRDDFCLYLLSCTKAGCGQQYVGQTYRSLYVRFSEHLADITDSTATSSVAEHWRQPGHKPSHLVFQGVEKVMTRSRAVLRERGR